MGLDQYLTREKTYIEKGGIKINKDGNVSHRVSRKHIKTVVDEIGYWRKFNALHNWFVKNCGDGIDSCQKMALSKEDFINLHSVLREVSELLKENETKTDEEGNQYREFKHLEKIKTLLPPVDGFFFGDTDIDEYYEFNVDETIKILEGIFKDEPYEELRNDYYYQASW